MERISEYNLGENCQRERKLIGHNEAFPFILIHPYRVGLSKEKLIRSIQFNDVEVAMTPHTFPE